LAVKVAVGVVIETLTAPVSGVVVVRLANAAIPNWSANF
jgi:hypothetical protein